MNQQITEHALTIGIRQLLNMHRIWHFKHWGGPMGEKGVSDIIGCKELGLIGIVGKTIWALTVRKRKLRNGSVCNLSTHCPIYEE